MNIENIEVKALKANNVIEKVTSLINFEAPIIPSITVNRKNVAKVVKADIGILSDRFDSEDKLNILKELQEKGFYHFDYATQEIHRFDYCRFRYCICPSERLCCRGEREYSSPTKYLKK